MEIVWTSDLNTEIEVIDNQHKRIVDYINRLDIAIEEQNRILVGQVLSDLVDYTQSHFAFEESLLEEVNYPHSKPHKAVHELFIKRVEEYQEKHNNGADVAEQVHAMLATWLTLHIKKDDMTYVSAVRANIRQVLRDKKEGNWLSRSLEQFFKPVQSS
jgi:hemerythrin